MAITFKDENGVQGMRVAGRLASEVLDFLTPHVVPGVTTNELDRLCHDYITQVQGAIPAPLNYAPSGYDPYPKSICTSINHQVCHGIPNDKALKKALRQINDAWQSLTDDDIEQLARVEHVRWCSQLWLAGWQYAPKRDDQSRRHTDLVDYEMLSDGLKGYDRDAVRGVPAHLQHAAFGA
jgi:methionine aminopeptidase